MRLFRALFGLRKAALDTGVGSKVIEKYAAYNPSPMSLEKLITFGTDSACARKSYRFLRKELAVRLANMMKEMNHLPQKLLSTSSVRMVHGWYMQSFEEVLEFEGEKETDAAIDDFTEVLIGIRNRHAYVVETMAEGVLDLREQFGISDTVANQIQYFLDRFYMMRISIRMLINQHTLLFGSQLGNHPRHIGCIDPNCNVIETIEDAYENARFVCDQYYLTSPSIDLVVHNGVEGSKDLPMVYVPSHLYHIIFELFKNAMRAVVETHENAPVLPKIKVLIAKGDEDITIKVSDQGGGIPRSKVDRLFEYMYSTAPQPLRAHPGSPPIAGYGYGLPLSRLYARYFHGDILLNSVEGCGTDAMVYLKVFPNDAHELLPVYNRTSSRVYETSPSIGDWRSNGVCSGKVFPNDAHELLPVYNRTSSRVYETSPSIGDWSSNGTLSQSMRGRTNHHVAKQHH